MRFYTDKPRSAIYELQFAIPGFVGVLSDRCRDILLRLAAQLVKITHGELTNVIYSWVERV